jgi:hypothetical protein
MSEQEQRDRIGAMRMQVAALHTALRGARQHLDDTGQLPEKIAKGIDEALAFGEPDGVAIFATARSIAAAAREPERMGELGGLADRLERLIGAVDGE